MIGKRQPIRQGEPPGLRLIRFPDIVGLVLSQKIRRKGLAAGFLSAVAGDHDRLIGVSFLDRFVVGVGFRFIAEPPLPLVISVAFMTAAESAGEIIEM